MYNRRNCQDYTEVAAKLREKEEAALHEAEGSAKWALLRLIITFIILVAFLIFAALV